MLEFSWGTSTFLCETSKNCDISMWNFVKCWNFLEERRHFSKNIFGIFTTPFQKNERERVICTGAYMGYHTRNSKKWLNEFLRTITIKLIITDQTKKIRAKKRKSKLSRKQNNVKAKKLYSLIAWTCSTAAVI